MTLARHLAVLTLLGLPAAASAIEPSADRIAAVRTFADNVLRLGRDTYGPRHTPLFVDGLHVDTHEPVTWLLPTEHAEVWNMPRRWVLCNLASQQQLFRVLDALTTLTGEPRYREAAVEAIRYGFAHLRHTDGLLFWGGHAAWELVTDRPVGESNKDWSVNKPIPAHWDTGLVHELKCHFPYYELMWQVDAQATRRLITSIWASHVQRWDILDMNRHGLYGVDRGPLWDHTYTGGPVPFVSRSLSFLHTGSDLVWAAGLLSQFDDDPRPLTWAKRLAGRYAEVRDPNTRLGADNYNIFHNHRIRRQFEAQFGDRFTEASITSLYGTRYGPGAVCFLKLAERLGPAGDAFRTWVVEDLAAYAKHAYDPQDGRFWVTLIDGTRLKPEDCQQPGYITPGNLAKRAPGPFNFWAYALAYKLTGDAGMWEMARQIGLELDLGDLGETPGGPARLNLQTTAADPHLIFAILDLHSAMRESACLALATRIADNLVARQFHKGFFLPSADHLFAKFDDATPLALLYLEAALRDPPVVLPPYCGGRSFFHCDYEGQGRTYDGFVYGQTRGE